MSMVHPVTHEERVSDRAAWEQARPARIMSGFRDCMPLAGGHPRSQAISRTGSGSGMRRFKTTFHDGSHATC